MLSCLKLIVGTCVSSLSSESAFRFIFTLPVSDIVRSLPEICAPELVVANLNELLWYKSTEPLSLKSAKVFNPLIPLPVPCALKLSETAVNCLNVSLFVSLSFIKAKPSFKFLRRILDE